jgi:hypothetical protein
MKNDEYNPADYGDKTSGLQFETPDADVQGTRHKAFDKVKMDFHGNKSINAIDLLTSEEGHATLEKELEFVEKLNTPSREEALEALRKLIKKIPMSPCYIKENEIDLLDETIRKHIEGK